jgi:uncharacterized BrkB/YihY/UPF0761 family membrane protein
MLSTDLDTQALDAFQVLTIFVAFVTVLFGIRYSSLLSAASDPLPETNKPDQRKNARKTRRIVLWVHSVPLALLTGISAFLFLPLAIRILDHGQFRFWNFDLVTEGYVLLTAYMFVFFVWTLALTMKISIKAFRK